LQFENKKYVDVVITQTFENTEKGEKQLVTEDVVIKAGMSVLISEFIYWFADSFRLSVCCFRSWIVAKSAQIGGANYC
jgi:hypothetical protein